jgi:hypothetical protein
MFKTFTLAGLIAALLFGAIPAHAGTEANGLFANGMVLNGFTLNGFTLNGFTLNGFTLNGTDLDVAPRLQVIGVELPVIAN